MNSKRLRDDADMGICHISTRQSVSFPENQYIRNIYELSVISIMAKNVFVEFKENGLYGLKDTEGHRLTDAMYDDVKWLNSEVCGVCKEGKWGFINQRGKEVVPTVYDDSLGFSLGLAAVCKDGLWGFVNESGNVAIPFEYDNVYDFEDGYEKGGEPMAVVSKGSLEGVINQRNEVILPIKYDCVLAHYGKWIIANTPDDELSGLFDNHGKQLLPFEFGDLCYEGDGLFSFSRGEFTADSKYGIIDWKGHEILPQEYDEIREISSGVSHIIKDNKSNCIDLDGKFLLERWYDDLVLLADDMVLLKDGGKYYLKDSFTSANRPCTDDIFGVYSPDGRTMLLPKKRNGKIVVRKNVENLAYLRNTDEDGSGCSQITKETMKIVFQEGVTQIGKGWDKFYYDPDDRKLTVFLPSTLKKIDQSAFKDMTDFIKQIYVPAKNFKMLEPMLPAHLRPLVKKQSWLAAVFCRLF